LNPEHSIIDQVKKTALLGFYSLS